MPKKKKRNQKSKISKKKYLAPVLMYKGKLNPNRCSEAKPWVSELFKDMMMEIIDRV